MTKGTKLNTIIDGDRLKALDNWLTGDAGKPKQGTKPVADVNEYFESEKSAQQLDPPGSAKSIARAIRRAHGMAVGVAESGLTFDALCKIVADLAPPANRNRLSAVAVASVIKGLLLLHTKLEEGGGE